MSNLFRTIIDEQKKQRKRNHKLQINSQRAEIAGAFPRTAFSDLPAAGIAGRVYYVSDGRKVGEGAGSGTGVCAYDDGVAWRRFSDDTTVAV